MMSLLYSRTGNRTIKIVNIFLLFLFICCNNSSKVTEEEYNIIYTEKGFYDMEESLKPLILNSKKRFYGLYEINKANSVATLNKNGDYSILTIDKYEQVEINTIKYGFPKSKVSKSFSAPEYNIIWGKRVRGLYILDIETKETRFCSASGESNAEILGVQIIDFDKKFFLIELVDHAIKKGPYCFYVIYDFINDKIIYESELTDATLNFLNNDIFLTMEYID